MEESESGTVDFWYSIGLHVGPEGVVGDVLHGGVGDRTGLGPGMKIVAVNGRQYDPNILRAAIIDAQHIIQPIELIVENTGFYKVLQFNYHGGEKFPVLERVAGTPDRLDEILMPMTH
jgi:predicted metalloprotease with PDZ domain